MTIKEVLEADWTVDHIEIRIISQNPLYVGRYCIGEKVGPCKYEKFVCETKAGDIYGDGVLKTLYIKKNIQFRNKRECPKGKEGCVGVLIEEIPKEILNLEVEYMRPDSLGHSSGMHGYSINCRPVIWFGVPGERESI